MYGKCCRRSSKNFGICKIFLKGSENIRRSLSDPPACPSPLSANYQMERTRQTTPQMAMMAMASFSLNLLRFSWSGVLR